MQLNKYQNPVTKLIYHYDKKYNLFIFRAIKKLFNQLKMQNANAQLFVKNDRDNIVLFSVMLTNMVKKY